jgi:hypothetical protein
VGDWVESLAHDELLERGARISEIESASSGKHARSGDALAPREHAVATAPTEPSQSGTRAASKETPERSRTKLLAAISGGIVLLLVVAFVLFSRLRERDGAGVAAASSDPSAAAAPEASTAASAAPSDVPPEPSASTAPTSLAPTRRAPPPRKHSPQPSNCDPPYWIDKDLHKIYKPGCL